jgi:hypothetical protein
VTYSRGTPVSSSSSSRTAPALSSGLFWLPHFGDCTLAERPGTVHEVKVVAGDVIQEGDVLVVLAH